MPKLPIGCSRSCARASGWSARMAACGAGTGSCADPTPVAPPPHVCSNGRGCASCGESGAAARDRLVEAERGLAAAQRGRAKLLGKRSARRRARAKRRAANSRRVGALLSKLGPMTPLWPPRSARWPRNAPPSTPSRASWTRAAAALLAQLDELGEVTPSSGHRRTARGGAPGRGAARTGRPPGSRSEGGSGPGADRVDRGTGSPGARPRRRWIASGNRSGRLPPSSASRSWSGRSSRPAWPVLPTRASSSIGTKRRLRREAQAAENELESSARAAWRRRRIRRRRASGPCRGNDGARPRPRRARRRGRARQHLGERAGAVDRAGQICRDSVGRARQAPRPIWPATWRP